MTIEKQWDFFIAHAGKDAERAKDFYEYLSSSCRAFLDAACLNPGDNWDIDINKAQHNANTTIALISADIQSAYYAREEIATGIALERQNDQAHHVVPVYLDGMPMDITQVPYGLRLKHGIDVVQIGGLEAAANKILSMVGSLSEKVEAETLEKTNHILASFISQFTLCEG